MFIITILSSLQSSFCFSIKKKKASRLSENVIQFYGLLFPLCLLNLIVKQLRVSFVEKLKSSLNDTIKDSSSLAIGVSAMLHISDKKLDGENKMHSLSAKLDFDFTSHFFPLLSDRQNAITEWELIVTHGFAFSWVSLTELSRLFWVKWSQFQEKSNTQYYSVSRGQITENHKKWQEQVHVPVTSMMAYNCSFSNVRDVLKY